MTAIAPLSEHDEERLVAAVRQGDDRAFEALYARYHDRIAAFVLSRVRDRGRAEDVTQEVFVSALRAMRGSRRPIAFEPWLYRIARNACIDQHRARRAEEVPVDDALVSTAHTPDSAVIAKQDLQHLCGAFGGLSDTCHEVLLLREFEGLSYAEIGERLGMSRGAVETSLLRARRRLAEEYDELATGTRCLKIQELIAGFGVGRALGRRAANRLARHVSHCQPCRREALAAGMEVTYVPLRRRAAEKIAALLPLPFVSRLLLRGRGGDEAAAWMAASPASEQVAAGWAKAAALVALLVVGAGGVGTRIAADEERAPSSRGAPERSRSAAVDPVGGVAAFQGASTDANRVVGARKPAERARRSRDGARDVRAPRADRGAAAPGSGAGGVAPARDEAVAGGGGSRSSPSAQKTPAASRGSEPLKPVTDGAAKAVGGLQKTVDDAAQGLGKTLDGVDQTVQGSPQAVSNTLEGINETVTGATGGLEETLEGATEGLDETVGGLLGAAP